MIPDFYHLWFHEGLYCHWDWGVFQNHRKKDDVCQQCTNTSRSPVSIHYFWFWARFLGESNHIAAFLLKLIMSDFGELVANVELLTTYILARERSPASTLFIIEKETNQPKMYHSYCPYTYLGLIRREDTPNLNNPNHHEGSNWTLMTFNIRFEQLTHELFAQRHLEGWWLAEKFFTEKQLKDWKKKTYYESPIVTFTYIKKICAYNILITCTSNM